MNYMQYLNPGQSKPLPGKDMVQNSAGGYSFEISPQDQLERFLYLGTQGNTYYATEEKLTSQNADKIIDYIKKDGMRVLITTTKISVEGGVPRYNTILFTYALILSFATPEVKVEAYKVLSTICRTATHLFQLLAYLKPIRKWSRGLRTAVAKWYLDKPIDKLEYQILKFKNRSGYSHKDALRLSHPKCYKENLKLNQLLKYAVGKCTAEESGRELVMLVEAMGKVETAESLCYLMNVNSRITWEMVPTRLLNDKAVLIHLLDQMPLIALTRNLNRFTYTGCLEEFHLLSGQKVVDIICDKLTDEKQIHASRIHPINVINTMLTYAQGHGDKGNKTWKPHQKIIDSLHEMYLLSVKCLRPSGKNILIGVDCSGSMASHRVGNMAMSPFQASMVLAHTMLKSEPGSEVVLFDTTLHTYPFGARNSIDEVLKHTPHGGGTDCALPIGYALERCNNLDAIIIFTDNETWAGRMHPSRAIDVLRKTMKRPVKVIEVALIANPYTNHEDHPDTLRVVGFNASVIQVIQRFIGIKPDVIEEEEASE